MTREEAAIEVLKVTRICRGPLMFSTEKRELLQKVWLNALQSQNFQLGVVLKTALERALGKDNLVCDDWEALLRRVSSLIYAHTEACGYNVNERILTGPMDGTEVIFDCPLCGSQIEYTCDYGVTD